MRKLVLGMFTVLAVMMMAVGAYAQDNKWWFDEVDAKMLNETAFTAPTEDFLGAGFHCNTFGGNGRVYPELRSVGGSFDYEGVICDKKNKDLFKGNSNKATVHLGEFLLKDEKGKETKTWILLGIEIGDGCYVPVCVNKDKKTGMVCGWDVWVAFSNQSGVPNGKNMQFNHGVLPKTEVEEGELAVSGDVTLVYPDLYTRDWWNVYQPWEKRSRITTGKLSSVTATTQKQLDAERSTKNSAIVPNSSHFTFAELAVADLEEGVELEMVNGSGLVKVGKGFVKKVGNNLELTFDPFVGTCEFGAVASSTKFNPKNGNEHSGQGSNNFKHDNKAVIACPAGDVIYLYVHFASVNFDRGPNMTPGGLLDSGKELVRTAYGKWYKFFEADDVWYQYQDVEEGFVFTILFNGEPVEISDSMEAGQYVVTFADPIADDEDFDLVSMDGSRDNTINLGANETKDVKYSAVYDYIGKTKFDNFGEQLADVDLPVDIR